MATVQQVTSDDPRLGDLVRDLDLSKERSEEELAELLKDAVVLLGFPWDEGVKRNGGRVGAAEGPAALRTLLPRMGTIFNPEHGINLRGLKVFNAGDACTPAEVGSLEEAHEILSRRVETVIKHGGVPFVVGGGNDQSYPNASGLLRARQAQKETFTVVNIDAHFDVRPLKNNQVHSGSPFRLLLQDPLFRNAPGHRFIEYAAQGNQCSAEHARYIQDQQGEIFWFSRLLQSSSTTSTSDFASVGQSFRRQVLQNPNPASAAATGTSGRSVFVSFDLDSVASSFAPGVSCPGTIGLSSQDALDICFVSGFDPQVKLFDLSEYNPKIESYLTGRLVVNMFYYFLLGFAQRLQKQRFPDSFTPSPHLGSLL